MTTGRLLTGAAAARVALRALAPLTTDDGWRRSNHRGRDVSLLPGPALAAGASVGSTSPVAALVAATGAALIGRYDDVVGASDDAKGLRGHLGALAHGRLTTGAVKLVGLPLVGAAAAAATGARRGDVLLGGAVVAGTANLLNLLDLRPGRALKVGLVAGVILGEPSVVGSCAVLLPGDLHERTMLGDAGANALGSVLGVAVLTRLRSRATRGLVLAGLAWLTAASERVSFTSAIERTPALSRLDQLGRLP